MTKRRGETEPMFKRRHQDFTPAQLARQAEVAAENIARARELHPERFAPDGSQLILYPGRDWNERLYSWRAQNGYPGLPIPESFGSVGASRGSDAVSAVVGAALGGQAGTPS